MKSPSLNSFREQCKKYLSFLLADYGFTAEPAKEHRLGGCFLQDYTDSIRVGVVYGRDDYDVNVYFPFEPNRSWPVWGMPYRIERKPIPTKLPPLDREDLRQQAEILRSCLPRLLEIAIDKSGDQYRALVDWSVSEAKVRYEQDREKGVIGKKRRRKN